MTTPATFGSDIAALIKRVDTAIHHLTNCTDDPSEGPYLAESAANMEARKEAAGEDWDWEHDGIAINIADDCEFLTVHGFEGDPQWNTADAIVAVPQLLCDLRAALLAATIAATARVSPPPATAQGWVASSMPPGKDGLYWGVAVTGWQGTIRFKDGLYWIWSEEEDEWVTDGTEHVCTIAFWRERPDPPSLPLTNIKRLSTPPERKP